MIGTLPCACQGVRNLSFSANLTHVLNECSPTDFAFFIITTTCDFLKRIWQISLSLRRFYFTHSFFHVATTGSSKVFSFITLCF